MFGLAFLNFVGTVLFFVMVLFLLKGFGRKMRYAKGAGHWESWQASRGWCDGHNRFKQDDYDRSAKHHDDQDEAVKLARERLANGEMNPEDYVAINDSLQQSNPRRSPAYPSNDDAINTLRMRLVKGEISVEEFDKVRQVLQRY